MIIAFLIVIAFVLFAVPYQRGGYLNVESVSFLQNYLDERGFLAKIFDPIRNDWGLYQGRELSYLFDWLDAQWIMLSVKLGIPMFFQVSHFMGIAVIACVNIWLWKRYAKELSLFWLTLISLLFVTSPISFFSGNYFRTSKILVGLCLYALTWKTYLRLRTSQQDKQRLSLCRNSFFWIALFMSLVDRQGFYFTICLGIFFVVYAFLYKRFQDRAVLISLGAAAIFSSIYNFALGPLLIRLINGYWPDFSYQKIPMTLEVFKHYWLSLNLAVDHLRFFFGNMWKQASVLFAFLIWGSFLIKSDRTDTFRNGLKRFALVFMCFAFVCSMYSLMRLKHDALGWPYLRRIYYWIPTNVLILFLVTIVARRLYNLFPRLRLVFTGGLLIAFAYNLQQLEAHDVIIKIGYCKNEIAAGPRLRACTIEAGKPISAFDLNKDQEGLCTFIRKKLDAPHDKRVGPTF